MHPLTQLLTRLRTDLRSADGKSSRRPGACRTAALVLAAVVGLCAFPPLSVEADKHREVPYDIETIRSAEDVQVMLDYATSWEGKITYASSQNNSDPQKLRRRELEDGGATDCSCSSSFSATGGGNGDPWLSFDVIARFLLVFFISIT